MGQLALVEYWLQGAAARELQVHPSRRRLEVVDERVGDDTQLVIAETGLRPDAIARELRQVEALLQGNAAQVVADEDEGDRQDAQAAGDADGDSAQAPPAPRYRRRAHPTRRDAPTHGSPATATGAEARSIRA